MVHVEAEWQAKLASLKSTHPTTLARSRQAIEDAWTTQVALDPLRNEVFWIGIAIRGRSWAIPMGHSNGEVLVPEERGDGSTIPPEGMRAITSTGKESIAKKPYFIPASFSAPPAQLTQEQVFTVLESVFMDPEITKINQNVKFDTKSVAKYFGGELPEGDFVDLQVLMHILNENLRNYRLTTILQHVYGYDPYQLTGKLGERITTEPFSKACLYVHLDARWPWMTAHRLLRIIQKNQKLVDALSFDVPVTRVLARMEMNGVMINQQEMTKLDRELDLAINNTLASMGPYVPAGFNVDSTNDRAKLLFTRKKDGGLGLRPTKLTPTKETPSVDEEVLNGLRGKHPVVDLLLEYAELKKLKSTYVENLPARLHSGRIHPQFNLHRTKTGRLSASDPNLQNIPVDGRIRSLFIAEPGNSLIVADYSQIEMRIMGMVSQDKALLRIFRQGIDPHFGTAQVILKRDPVDSKERNIYGKIPNFLLAYGGQAKRLAVATKGQIDLAECERIVAAYDSGYAGWTRWKKELLHKARAQGFVETLGGRRRRLGQDLMSDDWKKRWGAERQAINAVVQGTAAEICKEAMVLVDDELSFPKCRILIQVHDELVISVPTNEVDTWQPIIEKAMGNGRVIRGVPLVVDAHSARSWAEAKGA
jgi:DNA polymerase-1